MIIGHDLMTQLVLTDNFKRQAPQWDDAPIPMNEPSGLLGKSDLGKRKISEVVI